MEYSSYLDMLMKERNTHWNVPERSFRFRVVSCWFRKKPTL